MGRVVLSLHSRPAAAGRATDGCTDLAASCPQEDPARSPRLTRARVCIFHNMVAPYRLPLFDRLTLNHDIVVLFGLERAADRMWSTSLDGVKFAHRVLPFWLIGPVVLNPSLAVELRRQRPDVVIHADSDESLAGLLVLLVLKRALGYRLILWVEHVPRTEASLDTTRASRHRLQWPLIRMALRMMMAVRRYAYRHADALLSMSGPASDRFIASLGTRRPIFTGTQVMPSSILLPSGPPRGHRHGPLRILFLGYLRANKNVSSLIRAFVLTTSGNEELIIAGSGPELETLQELAAGRTDVRFTGYVDGEEKVALLREADLLVMPSFIEPWGLVVNEALFYGVPVLVSRDAASSALIEDGRTGLVFDPARDDELEGCLRRYFTDPGLRARLRSGAAAIDVEVVAGVEHGVAHFERALAAVIAGSDRS